MILAGGSARRLGGIPKGLELVGDMRIIDRVSAALGSVCDTTVLVANDQRAATWLPGATLVTDSYPGAGGLAGIEAALGVGRDALVVAWDMPFVAPALLAVLAREAVARDATIVVPESESPHGFEPFCAFYAARVRAPLSAFLARGGGAARDFIARTDGVHRLPLADVHAAGDPTRMFFSVNTGEELARARAMAMPPG